MTVVKIAGLLVCGATLGVSGVVAWFVRWINKDGGYFRW